MLTREKKTVLYTSVAIVLALFVAGAITWARRDPAEQLYHRGVELLAAGKAPEANVVFDLIVSKYPASPFASEARKIRGGSDPIATNLSPAEIIFNDARNFYPKGSLSRYDLEQAAVRYLAVCDSYPDDPIAPSALFEAAQCYDALGDRERTAELWKRFDRDYPDDGRAPEALFALAFLHSNHLRQAAKGKQYYMDLISRYPNTSSAEEARKILGMETEGPEEKISSPDAPLPVDEPSSPPSVLTPGGNL